jgi:alkanesulfonate monooxygenase SsuD/methylene tetrahydromethanopterin reductase-like flavin-dependent oxidoreductase (luciferase family)
MVSVGPEPVPLCQSIGDTVRERVGSEEAMARPGSPGVACIVRPVRPVGLPSGVGLLLPTIPWLDIPGKSGSTDGNHRGPTVGATNRLQALARDAERAGADGLWASDHLFWHRPVLEPLTSLAVLATATSTVTLGTCVLQLPLRNPTAVARQAGTLQLLSGGRLVLGLGVGSHAGEYDSAGVDFASRGRLLDDGIAALRRAWSSAGDTTLRYRQEPPVPAVPLWIGGSSPAALRRAALLGDGWVPLFVPAGAYGSLRRRVLDQAAESGRDPNTFVCSVVVPLCTGPSAEVARKEGTHWLAELYDLPPKAFERHLIAGSPEDCAAAIAAYRDAGADHVIAMVTHDETIDHFGPVLEACDPPVASRVPERDRPPAFLGAAP